MAAASESSSSTSPRATSTPRPASLAAASSERASATISSSPSSSLAVSAPPMKPVAPVTKMRATSGGRGAGELAALGRGRVGARVLEERADTLHHVGAVLVLIGVDRGAEADLDRMALERPPGPAAHPVAADRHHLVGAGDVDRLQPSPSRRSRWAVVLASSPRPSRAIGTVLKKRETL